MVKLPPLPKECVPIVSVPDLLVMARGRWIEILTDAGVPAEALADRRGRPCPRCGGRDRFAALAELADRGSVICRHCFNGGTEPRPGDGLASLRWWLGVDAAGAAQWLAAWLGVGSGHALPSRRPVERRLVIPDADAQDDRFAEMADRYFDAMTPGRRVWCAGLIELPPEPLVSLRVGWVEECKASSWPMRDAKGRVIGIRLRCPKRAKKWAVTGSRAGLFIPADLACTAGRLFVSEGPTDTAALLSIGLAVVGVPSAGGAADLVAALVRERGPIEVIVMADADGPGRAGAESLAEVLLSVRPVRVVSPPDGFKDARNWIGRGADRRAVLEAVGASPVKSLTVRRATR
jgi:phage/plasmid primase-like uncharacterized protein